MNAKDYCAIGWKYAEQVVAGEIPACRWVKLACQRQLDDLAKGWPWRFDAGRAVKVCRFIEHLPHIEGRWKTRNIELEPWQCFLLSTIFGWVDQEGFRRFRKAYLELPRKQSKSTMGAAVGLYMLCADGEPGPKVYSAAVTRDQAKYSWDTAQKMVLLEPEMRAYYGVEALAHSIVVAHNAGAFKPLSRDADTLEGSNVHCAIIDELHVHKTREVWDVLNLGSGSRRQSLLWTITTAGDNKAGVCYEQHEYIEQILSGRHEDDRYFGIIYTLDESDDWTTEESARKANPNYGVSVIPDDLKMLCQQAQRSAESQNAYKNKRLNLWTSVGTSYFNMLAWQNKCHAPGSKLEDFYERRCIVAIDLASKDDLAAKIMLFRDEQGIRYVFGRYWLPESAAERGHPNYDVYGGWAKAGWITLTPDDEIDFEFIERELVEDRNQFDVAEFAYDPFQARQLSQRMRASEGLPMVEVGATVQNFSEPMKALAAMILNGKIKHNGDPVLGWMLGNVYAKRDAKDNVYPRKTRNENKIDGAVALIMAIGREAASAALAPSVYEERGIRTI